MNARDADTDRARLEAAVKPTDGFFTTFFVSPYSKFIARAAARAGITPNQVTVFSMLLGLAAAVAFAFGSTGARIVGAVLLQAAFVFDCVDGQLARYTRNFTSLGAWLDAMFDRGKEFLVFAGLAYGAVRTGSDEFIWLLASGALAAQVTRNYLDLSFGAATSGSVSRLGVADRAEQSWLRWPKRIIVLPIGERFALISVTAAIWGATVTFASLLIWGGVAALYSTTGRVLRTAS